MWRMLQLAPQKHAESEFSHRLFRLAIQDQVDCILQTRKLLIKVRIRLITGVA
jgi:hypothetical protein